MQNCHVFNGVAQKGEESGFAAKPDLNSVCFVLGATRKSCCTSGVLPILQVAIAAIYPLFPDFLKCFNLNLTY